MYVIVRPYTTFFQRKRVWPFLYGKPPEGVLKKGKKRAIIYLKGAILMKIQCLEPDTGNG